MQQLNQNQYAAAVHLNGPMMVLAGPGSGKTTVILHRIMYLISNGHAKPSEVLVITFTKAASEEMRARFRELGGSGKVDISTFHSLFYRVISAHYGYRVENVLSEIERTQIIKSILKKNSLPFDEEFTKSISSEFSLIKNELIDITHYNSHVLLDDFGKIYTAYEDYKKERHKIDFDDMTASAWSLFMTNKAILSDWQSRYKYILIDEFQDINRAQYECIRLLNNKGNLFIVGDDDQSIYSFRGARPEFLLNFSKDFPDSQKIILDINYRSTEKIIGLCNKVIRYNMHRYEKDLKGTGKNGPTPTLLKSYDAQAEAADIATKIQKLASKTGYNEIAVIYRNNIQSRAYIDVFLNLNIPFQIKDETPGIYEHWAFKDIIAYLKLSQDLSLKDEALRIINKPKRYISKDLLTATGNKGGPFLNNLLNMYMQKWQREPTLELVNHLGKINKYSPEEAYKFIRCVTGYNEYIREYSNYRKIDPKGLYDILDELQEGAAAFGRIPEYIAHVEKAALVTKNQRLKKTLPAGVMLTTMHSAKGLEFDTVFVISAVEGLIPYERSITDEEIEEERRLFYVALTRAKRLLYVSIIKTRHDEKMKPSMFLRGL